MIRKIKYELAKSNIHGTGVFSIEHIKKNEIIDKGIVFMFIFIPQVTDYFGRWINHSFNPNSYLFYCPIDNVHYVIAKYNIPMNTEITIDYRETPWYINRPGINYKP